MRGDDRKQTHLFHYLSLEERIPKDRPFRPMRRMVDQALEELSARFDRLHASRGRPR